MGDVRRALDRVRALLARVSPDRDRRSGGAGRSVPEGGRPIPDGGRSIREDDRESVLTDLYEASHELMMAETTGAIADTAVETARVVLGLSTAVLYVDDGDLVRLRSTDGAAGRPDEEVPPDVARARGTDDVTVYDADDAGPFDAGTAGVVVGLGDNGVLAVGDADRESVPEAVVEYVELLAGDVEVALERARRESLLRDREREVRESREKIARLHEAATKVVACREETELYDLTIDIAERVLDFDMCTVMIADGDRLVPRATSSGTPTDGVEAMGVEEGLAGETYRTGESSLVEDVRDDDASAPVKSTYRSAISVPVGEYGVFQAVATEPRAFDDHDLEFAELLVAHVGETATRIRAERDLQESEAKFREIAENVESVVWMTDPAGQETLYVSPAFETVWGRPPEVVEEDPAAILEWIHEGDRDRALEAFEGTDGYDLQYRIRRPDGEVRWVHDRAFPIGEDGEVTRMVGLATDVTERKRRETELERYETVFETVQDRVYVLDRNGRFRMVNDPFLEMVGHDRETVLGAHVSLVLGEAAVDRLQAAGAALGRGPERAKRLELEVETADGERIPCETDVAALPADEEFPGLVGVLRDISDRKRVETQLQVERDRLSVLFENIPDPVVEAEVGDDGQLWIRSVNPAFESVFGVDAAGVRNDRLADHVLPPAADPGDDGLWDCAAGDGPHQEEVRRLTDEGIRHFLLRGIPFETGEGTTSTFGIYTDISDQKRRQRQLQVLNRVLRHNLRNDMNKVVGYADLLAEAAQDPEQERRAATARNVAEGIVSLSESVRQLGTALDDDVERARPIDVVDLLEDLLEPYCARRDVTVRTSLPETSPVDADARLQLALENLLENAVEHSDRETPTVEVSVESVDADRGEWVDVVVADDGPGIPGNERTVLTEEREITEVEHGSGLGLWVVNWVVSSLGGDVSLSDDDSRGSEITIRLRAADTDDVGKGH